MELGRELFECPVSPLGDILAPLAEGWFWIETKRGVAIMAEAETPWEAPDVGSHPVLSATGDDSTLAVGDGSETGLGIVEQIDELGSLLREFARNAQDQAELMEDSYERRKFVDANKYLLRCVDNCNRFCDEYR